MTLRTEQETLAFFRAHRHEVTAVLPRPRITLCGASLYPQGAQSWEFKELMNALIDSVSPFSPLPMCEHCASHAVALSLEGREAHTCRSCFGDGIALLHGPDGPRQCSQCHGLGWTTKESA